MNRTIPEVVVVSVLAGGFVTVGALFATVSSTGTHTEGLAGPLKNRCPRALQALEIGRHRAGGRWQSAPGYWDARYGMCCLGGRGYRSSMGRRATRTRSDWLVSEAG